MHGIPVTNYFPIYTVLSPPMYIITYAQNTAQPKTLLVQSIFTRETQYALISVICASTYLQCLRHLKCDIPLVFHKYVIVSDCKGKGNIV